MSHGNPSPSTDVQVSCQSHPSAGRDSWDHLDLREEMQLSPPGEA